MSYWNHRVVKKHYPETDETFFTIHESHYNDNGDLYGYTESGVDPCGESIEDLRDILNRMLRALDKPVLVHGEVVFAPITDFYEDEGNE
jgi:hypothetical protein